jgi:HPt (histidine-containing phosphotransfer) domain-containing protein
MCNSPHTPTLSVPAAGGAAPALDPAAALARAGGDVRLLGELVGFFLEDSDRWLADLAGALGRGDAAGVQFTAHLLRGSAANFGAHAACRAGRAVEELARAGDLPAAAGACGELKACLLRLRPALLALARTATEGPA